MKDWMRMALIAGLLCAQPAFAETSQQASENTRVAAAGQPRPAARIADLAWIVGRWEGEGIEGAPAQETWSSPLGGMIHGTFVQGDGKGGVMFSEMMQIAPDGDSLVVRLKHFNADLTGWEEKDKSVSFPLVARDGDSWYFNGLTYRREGRNRLFVAVRMRGEGGKVSELVFRFRRAGR